MPVAIPLAIAGASVAGAAISSNASKSAARTVQQGTDAATAEQRRQFDAMLRLAMPGYNRANAAGDVYSRALGLGGSPSNSSGSAQIQNPYGPQFQPSMTGGYQGGFGGGGNGRGGVSDFASVQSLDGGASPMAGMMTGSYTNGQGGMVPPPQQVPGGGPQPQGGMQGGQLDIAQQVMQTPGYQTQLDQGIKSIDRAAPLVGGMYSGRRMKALNDYGQQTFGSYYNDWMNRVGGLAGQEQQIAQNVGQAGMQSANNVGNLMMTGANARAQGTQNSAAAWSGALGNVAGGFAGYYG
jgi:hypothetical protein